MFSYLFQILIEENSFNFFDHLIFTWAATAFLLILRGIKKTRWWLRNWFDKLGCLKLVFLSLLLMVLLPKSLLCKHHLLRFKFFFLINFRSALRVILILITTSDLVHSFKLGNLISIQRMNRIYNSLFIYSFSWIVIEGGHISIASFDIQSCCATK